jgi:hypothetical protein
MRIHSHLPMFVPYAPVAFTLTDGVTHRARKEVEKISDRQPIDRERELIRGLRASPRYPCRVGGAVQLRASDRPARR